MLTELHGLKSQGLSLSVFLFRLSTGYMLLGLLFSNFKFEKSLNPKSFADYLSCPFKALQLGVHYLTIIPRARVGHEMIDSQRGA